MIKHYHNIEWGKIKIPIWDDDNFSEGIHGPIKYNDKSLKPNLQDLQDLRDKLLSLEDKKLFEQIRLYRNNFCSHVGDVDQMKRFEGLYFSDTYELVDKIVEIYFEMDYLLTGNSYGLDHLLDGIKQGISSLYKKVQCYNDIRNIHYKGYHQNGIKETSLNIYSRLCDDLG